MTLSDFATFSTAISGLAVTASLIYLALQTHQNAKHTKALIFQGRADRNTNQYLMMANTELVSAWLIENGIAATPEEIRKRQFGLQCIAQLQGWIDNHVQHEEGLLSHEMFANLTDALAILLKTSPAMRQFVKQAVATDIPSTFVTYLTQLLARSELPDKAAVE